MEYTGDLYDSAAMSFRRKHLINKCSKLEVISSCVCLMFLMTNILLLIFIMDIKKIGYGAENMLQNLSSNFTQQLNSAIQQDLTYVMSYLQNNFTLHVAINL